MKYGKRDRASRWLSSLLIGCASLIATAGAQAQSAPPPWLANNSGPGGAQTYNSGYQLTGDFNGDGRADYLYNYAGWHVALSDGTSSFSAPTLWLANNGGPGGAQTYNAGYMFAGDFNGDGRADLLYNYAGWHVALSTGSGFAAPVLWLGNNGGPGGAQTYNATYPNVMHVGDFNGDGRTDFLYNYAGWHVALSTGSGFATPSLWLGNNGGPGGAQTFNSPYMLTGDFNGDGKDDYLYNFAGWHVAISTGSGFSTPALWLTNNGGPGGSQTYNSTYPGVMHAGDFDGDGKDDYLYNYSGWKVALSTGSGFSAPTAWLSNSGITGGPTFNAGYMMVGDVTGDGKTDYVWNYAGWRVAKSTGTALEPVAYNCTTYYDIRYWGSYSCMTPSGYFSSGYESDSISNWPYGEWIYDPNIDDYAFCNPTSPLSNYSYYPYLVCN